MHRLPLALRRGLLVVVLAIPPLVRWATWPSAEPAPVDRQMAAAGGALFHHEWTPNDPLAGGDGLGPVFNAESCVACHFQGGPGGAGPNERNVTVFAGPATSLTGRPARTDVAFASGVLHSAATRPALLEIALLGRGLERTSLNGQTRLLDDGTQVTQRNTPALFGAGLIDAIPDDAIISAQRAQQVNAALGRGDGIVGRIPRTEDGRIGRFGWKAQEATLREFVVAACANELGLGNPDREQAVPLRDPDYRAPALDLTAEQCDQMTMFIAALDRPVELFPPENAEQVERGRMVFNEVGCAICHTESLGNVDGYYSDMLLHFMGEDLVAAGGYAPPPSDCGSAGVSPPPSDDPLATLWRTPPLWGVADSAPYLHDGRAETLEEAIQRHGGDAAPAADRFNRLGAEDREALLEFLRSLRAPQPQAVAPGLLASSAR